MDAHTILEKNIMLAMAQECLPEEKFTCQVEAVDLNRMMQEAVKVMAQRSGSKRVAQILNVIVWIFAGISFATVFDLYKEVKDSQQYLLLAVGSIGIAIFIHFITCQYLRKKWRTAFYDGATWLTDRQDVVLSDDAIRITSKRCTFEYSWSVFSTSVTDVRGMILGGGAEPVVFIPSDSGVSQARLDWIRKITNDVSSGVNDY